MKKKILITGITGFVGSHMADYILENFPNFQIYASKRYHLSRLDKIEHVYEKIKWVDKNVIPVEILIVDKKNNKLIKKEIF